MPVRSSRDFYFLFNSYSFLIYFLFIDEEEKKAKASKDPIPNPQYICQYKIQPIVPNTFSNKESIAHKESLHNQLKKFIPFPSIVEGGGLLIPSSLPNISAESKQNHSNGNAIENMELQRLEIWCGRCGFESTCLFFYLARCCPVAER